MTLEQREHILRGLKKNSPLNYIGGDIKDAKGQKVVIKNNSTCLKIRNVHGHRIGVMIVVSIAGGRFFRFHCKDLTCKAIEVAERLEQSTKTPKP